MQPQEHDPKSASIKPPRIRIAALLVGISLPLAALLALDPMVPGLVANLPKPLTDLAAWTTDAVQLIPILAGLGAAALVAALVKSRRALETTLYAAVTTLVASGITHVLKQIFGRARPTLFETQGLYGRNPFSGQFDFESFPSGHATHAAALFAALAFAFPRFRYGFALLALWFAATRVILGVHSPSDVTAGLMIGTLTAAMIARPFARFGQRFHN